MKTRTRRVLCWIEPDFDVMDVASYCQVLSEAGSTWNWRAFRIDLVSTGGGLLRSRCQMAVQTTPLAAALASAAEPQKSTVRDRGPFDILVAGGGRYTPGASSPLAATLSHDEASSVEWVGLRGGLLPIVETGYFAGKTVAAPPRLQTRLLASEPQLGFSAAPWYRDGRLWSVACADATQAALALVQSHVGVSARRAIETTLGLTTTITPVHLASQPPNGENEP